MNPEISFGNSKIYNDQILDTDLAKQSFNIKIGTPDNQLSTLAIYDLSAPSPRSPSNSPFIHFLAVNIPGSKIDQGQILIHYTPPNPHHDSGTHVYVVDLYQQNNKIQPEVPDKRESFPLTQFVQLYNLTPQGRIIFRVNPSGVAAASAATLYNGQDYSRKHHQAWTQGLSEADTKYCDCVLEAAAKQPNACLEEKAWFQQREGHRCSNPYAVCHKSIEGESGRPNCTEHYIFENIPDNELEGYALLHEVPVPSPYDRQTLIQNIYQHEANLKTKMQQFQQQLASGQIQV